MNSDELNRRLDDELQSKSVLLHELQVHQIELEMQNRQLSEAQQQLEESRDRYADLYDYAPVGYLTLDEEGIVLGINLTGAGMLGTERMNIIGKSFINFLTPASIHALIAHLRQTFSHPGNSITELLIKTREGKPHLVSLESMAVPGEQRTCRTVLQDVTEQRRMAIALQISRSAQDALLNAIPALVFYQDINLRYLSCSQVFADFVGRPPEEIVGKTVDEIFSASTANDLHEVFAAVLETGAPLYGFEHKLSDSGDVSHYFSTVISPFRDFQGQIIGLVGVCLDITSIKNAIDENNALIVQNRKLTRNMFTVQEEERRYLARELHDELGQWFTAIQAEAQVICNIAKHTPEIRDSALAISNSASAVHQVIRGMLRKLRPSLLDELGLTESLRELQRQWCHSHPDIVCEFKLDDSLDSLGEERNITIYRLVQEALSNIASHAQAERVTVSLERNNAGVDGGIILLHVEDDGAGFDANSIHAGMGMLGMRERVIAAGGDFSINSAPGKGTKIFVWLPVDLAETD